MTSSAIAWTLADVGDLMDVTAVVTGGSSGVGRAVAGLLAGRGARVLIGARGADRARAVAAELRGRGRGSAEAAALDLAEPESVDAFATWVRTRTDRIGLLVNNAGISNQDFRLASTGVEHQFAINHLGHFALTGLLLPVLAADGHARVVTVSSELYDKVPLDLSLLADEAAYSPGAAYVRSKLANVLFSTELDRRLRRAGSTVRAAVAHPGLARTPLHDTYPSPETTRAVRAALAEGGREPDEAISGIVYAATSPHARPDVLYGPGGGPAGPHVTAAPLHGQALDAGLAAALWRTSTRLSGMRFPADLTDGAAAPDPVPAGGAGHGPASASVGDSREALTDG